MSHIIHLQLYDLIVLTIMFIICILNILLEVYIMAKSSNKMAEITQEEYDSLQKQLNNLQSEFIEQRKIIRELRSRQVDVIKEVVGWHEHTTSGILFWNPAKMPEAYVKRMDQRFLEMVAQRSKQPKPVVDNPEGIVDP
jgi:hypothetical protein